MSSRVVVRPRLKRIAPIPISGGIFIAFNTGDNSTEPEWQAEPVEAATFSIRARISDPALPIKLTFNVFGNRSVGCPLRAIWSPKVSCSSSHMRSRSCRTDSMPRHDWDIAQAAPKPTSSRTFSVPRGGPIRGLHRGSAVPIGYARARKGPRLLLVSKAWCYKKTTDGFTYLDLAQFHKYFAADLSAERAAFMARSQVLNFADNFKALITTAAWRSKPSWALVAGADRTINPDLERWYATRANSHKVEVSGASHAVYVSRPKEVAALIEEAASHAR
jgi:Alpha/beta hydrolase family